MGIKVIDPQSEVVERGFPAVTANNSFTYSFVAGEQEEFDFDEPMVTSGNYRMVVTYFPLGDDPMIEEVELVFEYDTAAASEAAGTISPVIGITTGVPAVDVPQFSSSEVSIAPAESNQTINLEAARKQYLIAWGNTDFSSQFDVFIEEGSALDYGVYKEHVSGNVFRPGETIVLYVEPVGFGHKPIITNASQDDGNSTTKTLYLVNMTADYIISDLAGSELQTIEDVPVANLISHRQNTELFLTLVLRQDQQSLPVGDYIVTYTLHDQVSGNSFEKSTFEIDKRVTISDNATTTAASSSVVPDNNSLQR